MGGPKSYGCLVDVSKAFNTVDHSILLEKLLSRGLPNVFGTLSPQMVPDPAFIRTKWNGVTLNAFSVLRAGVFVRVEYFHLFCSLFT